MAGPLRAIAVTVEEPEPGAFFWVLLEQGLEWEELSRDERSLKSYAKAMSSGLSALQDLIDNLDVGPREPEAERKSSKRATFGFGFGVLK